MTTCAPSERRGRAAAAQSTLLNLKRYTTTANSMKAVERFESRSATRSIEYDSPTAANHHQLSGAQFGDRIVYLSGVDLEFADFGFDDVRFCADVVHCFAPPVDCVGLLVKCCASERIVKDFD